MNAIQQLMIAIICVVLGVTSAPVFKPMSEQEMKILFWVSLMFLVWIFMWPVTKRAMRKSAKPQLRTPKTRKRKRGKRRARGP